ncbi:MAG: spore germination protein, partial [Christensenellaceae bacterium]
MDLTTHVQKLKNALPSEDILTFSFPCGNKDAALIYADGIVDKELLGRLVVTPLASYTGKEDLPSVAKALAFPEIRENLSDEELISGILEGNPALLLDGEEGGIVVGTKKAPARAVTEPQTELVTHGPRAGFIEDAKTNMALLRLRFKTERLRFETVTIGKQSRSTVVLCYLDGIVHRPALSEIKKKLSEISIDIVPDSSYLAKFLCPSTFFRLSGMTEKPDILAARMAEGRIGIILDGSPVVLTLPYLLVESFQAPG